MGITYQPEMLPPPDEGQEAEVVYVRDDGVVVRLPGIQFEDKPRPLKWPDDPVQS